MGTGSDVSIKELVELIMDIEDYHAELVFDPSKPDGMPQKLLDITNLSNNGWLAKTSLHDGLEKTYKYFQEIILPAESIETNKRR